MLCNSTSVVVLCVWQLCVTADPQTLMASHALEPSSGEITLSAEVMARSSFDEITNARGRPSGTILGGGGGRGVLFVSRMFHTRLRLALVRFSRAIFACGCAPRSSCHSAASSQISGTPPRPSSRKSFRKQSHAKDAPNHRPADVLTLGNEFVF